MSMLLPIIFLALFVHVNASETSKPVLRMLCVRYEGVIVLNLLIIRSAALN